MKSRFDYFGAFADFTGKAYSAAVMLNDTLKNYNPNDNERRMNEIHAIEHQADEIKHKVVECLSYEFVAPIEREDIVSLVREFDNVVDGIDEVMRKLCMYNIRAVREDILRFTSLLVVCCTELDKLTKDFRDFRKSKTLKDNSIRVNALESEADTVHYDAVSRLFREETDARTLMAWQSIYDALEDCFDNCEHAADIIEGIILKNS